MRMIALSANALRPDRYRRPAPRPHSRFRV